MVAERTNTVASELIHAGTGHFRWKASASSASGNESGSIDTLIFTSSGGANNSENSELDVVQHT